RQLRDLISSRAILLIAKARMIWIQLHNCTSVGDSFVSIACEHARINVVGKKLPFWFGCVGCHDPSPLVSFCGFAAAHGGEALPHRRHSIFKWRLCLRLRRRKAAGVRTICDGGWLISDSLTCSGLFQINRPLPQAVLTKLNRPDPSALERHV